VNLYRIAVLQQFVAEAWPALIAVGSLAIALAASVIRRWLRGT
jgi:hypothetical protein